MKVSIFARVCNQDQDALDKQVESLTQYAETNGYTVTSVTAVSGISGLHNKDSLQPIIDMAKTDDFDSILITEPSRISRDSVIYMEFVNELRKYGKTLECISRKPGNDTTHNELFKILNSIKKRTA